MPSRRQTLRGVGTALVCGLAGCASGQATTGVVAHKTVDVELTRTTGSPVDVTIALLTYEPDEGLVTGEYADIVPAVINGSSLSVSDAVSDRLGDRFAAVRYYGNIVPEDGSSPVAGQLTRTAFNSLSIGGVATVDREMKQADEDHAVSHLRVEESADRTQPPQKTRISQYSWDDRVDGILGRTT